MFFNSYRKKEDGVVRFYDLHSKRTRTLLIVIYFLFYGYS